MSMTTVMIMDGVSYRLIVKMSREPTKYGFSFDATRLSTRCIVLNWTWMRRYTVYYPKPSASFVCTPLQPTLSVVRWIHHSTLHEMKTLVSRRHMLSLSTYVRTSYLPFFS